MAEPIISVSGLRGIVGESLTPVVAIRYAAAFAKELEPGPMVLTRDSRGSGAMLAAAVRAALMAAGRETIDAGIAATPTTGILVRHEHAAGGIQISASHNPPEYNGMKLFAASGRVVPEAAGAAVLARYRAGKFSWSPHERIGHTRTMDDPHEAHAKLVLKIVDGHLIRGRRFHVLLDANHGAGGPLARGVLEKLGCRVTLLGAEPDGAFAHPAEPTEENLRTVASQVVAAGADVGFCQDPDADRLAVIDAAGRYLGEEYTLAMCVDHVLRRTEGPIVTNCSTSRMCEDLARRYGVPFRRSKVGEANVVDEMLAADAVFGGEGNGGTIDPRVGLVRDSFVAIALILEAMAQRELSVAELADELPRYHIVKTKVPLASQGLDVALEALKRHFSDATADPLDGLRLDWPDRWLLVRPSNTEPIIRLVAEASSRDAAAGLCDAAAAVLGQAVA